MPEQTREVAAPRPCPRCTYPLVAVHQKGNEVDHCHRCGGIFVEPTRGQARVGDWAAAHAWLDRLADQTQSEGLLCCVDRTPMTAYRFTARQDAVTVDLCRTCGGLWLDHQEAGRLVPIIRGGLAATAAPAAVPAAAGGQARPIVPAMSEQEFERTQHRKEHPGMATYIAQLCTGLPVEVFHPVHTVPALTLGLIGLNMVAYLQQVLLRSEHGIAAATAQFATWGMVPENILAGQALWTLLTYAFLHGGLFHLVGNLWALLVFGDNVEDRLGTARFAAIYFGAVIGAGLCQAVFDDGSLPTVGASGGVAGLMAAYLVLFPQVKLWVVILFIRLRFPVAAYMGLWLLANFAGAFGDEAGVAWWAHIGGFAVGGGLALLWQGQPHPLTRSEQRAGSL